MTNTYIHTHTHIYIYQDKQRVYQKHEMEYENSFTTIFVPVFDGLNYQMWAVKMEAYLDANDVWEAVEEDYEVPPLPNNPS